MSDANVKTGVENIRLVCFALYSDGGENVCKLDLSVKCLCSPPSFDGRFPKRRTVMRTEAEAAIKGHFLMLTSQLIGMA